MDPIVIVGAGLGGARVAESLRRQAYDGEIVLIGAERHHPYDRPPLSKSILVGESHRADLNSSDFYTEQRINLLLNTVVTAVDSENHRIELSSAGGALAKTIDYSSLILATGLRPRTLPFGGEMTDIHVLRTIDDALALRSAAKSAKNVVVIGAGFVGCEVAASLRTQGLSVTIVEPAASPLAAALGETVGNLVGRLLAVRGVEIRTGASVSGLEGERSVEGVLLADGDVVPADLVVVGIGSDPVTEYLEGSKVLLAERNDGGGILCDESGRSSEPDVYALGDVANWLGHDGTRRRSEHWDNVNDQANRVAAAVLGFASDSVPPSVPYFWSDQFDVKIQALGRPSAKDHVHVVSDDGSKFVAYYSKGGVLTGVVGAGSPRAVNKMRSRLSKKTAIAELL
ncbi:FAD-dependent oxidoreductase [Rhodococcus sp. 14-2686-1-2]|nr:MULTISPECIES: FAD-dependent oxidoreductase [unclassified Rhodococcus (in: high G+C Gram-positive bacteria)]OZE93556.1 FAD-dependent oxidoreductase [Rhodococcus sp. 15-1189-1-1a]OZF08482.1 FAD-dependent oxidoreductase [Rhodococcus sp. 14-2686-1-2]